MARSISRTSGTPIAHIRLCTSFETHVRQREKRLRVVPELVRCLVKRDGRCLGATRRRCACVLTVGIRTWRGDEGPCEESRTIVGKR